MFVKCQQEVEENWTILLKVLKCHNFCKSLECVYVYSMGAHQNEYNQEVRQPSSQINTSGFSTATNNSLPLQKHNALIFGLRAFSRAKG